MRRKVGLSLMLAGAAVALVGATIMSVLGPDGRVLSGPHVVETDQIAMVTAPEAITWTGVRIGVFAELPANKPVFVGLGDSLDVESYVENTSRIQVDGYQRPWELETSEIEGEPILPAAPTAIDWWIAGSAGLGGASISTRLPDRAVSLAILAVGASDLAGLEVTVSYEIKGGFGVGAGLVLLGVGVILLGYVQRAGISLRARADDYVYVYTDDDGAEHEYSADEWERDEASDEPEERVVYVYVDDDGVEHEVSAEKLAEYEVIDDDLGGGTR